MQTEASDTPSFRRDPWPSPQPAWQDPPWVLSGRVITAWFEAPRPVVEASLSPDLFPESDPPYRVRLRFYELEWEAQGVNRGQSLAPDRGSFREAAVGFPARAGSLEGDMSVFMWADSDTYLMWAREAFGWPLLRGEFEFAGDVWTGLELTGTSGRARVTDEWGTAAIVDAQVEAPAEPVSLAAQWVTPRRILRRAGLDGETRELQVVRPEVRRQGAQFSGVATVSFGFRDPHPLSLLDRVEATLHVVDGFELLVGGDVELV